MAISIDVKTDNGVVTNYHRIALVNVDVNQQITILVISYLEESGRLYEKDYEQGKITEEPAFPYTNGEYFHIQWDDVGILLEGNLLENMYSWLKKQTQFAGAVDA